jgi:hypothetical protein
VSAAATDELVEKIKAELSRTVKKTLVLNNPFISLLLSDVV